MEISLDFKNKVSDALIKGFEFYGGSKKAYARSFEIDHTVFSRILGGERNGVLAVSKWLEVARILQIDLEETNWVVVKTKFYLEIEDAIKYCQQYKEKKMLVDKCGVGKSEAAKSIVKTMKNAFYIDCSQSKKKIKFFRTLAKTLGVEYTGKYEDVKENIKFGLKFLSDAVIVLDEFGDLEYGTFLDIKEVLNATNCGWLAMGANGLRQKIDRGIENEKVGFEEVFDRFSGEISNIIPTGKDDYRQFMYTMLMQIANANNTSSQPSEKLVLQVIDKEGSIRKLRTLININS